MTPTKLKKAVHHCNQCGSDLILVKTIIEEKDMPSPVTTLIYRCSDKICQEDIDRKTSAQIKHNKEQEIARANRYKRPKNSKS